MDYKEFVYQKSHLSGNFGFKPVFMPDYLFDFQKYLVDWAMYKGRSAIFADCGLGKGVMQLVLAQNVVQKTNKRVLILAPLAVSMQTKQEAEKFGIDADLHCVKKNKITITNYQKLKHYNKNDFIGVVCDESSILKNFKGATKEDVTEFMKKIPYRLLATATAAPNDYIELGTSSESLGYLGFMDMLNRFFKNDLNNSGLRRMYGEAPKWRFKGYAEKNFWRWICSWGRACRFPSDLGFCDEGYILEKLKENNHIVEAKTLPDGCFLPLPAKNLDEQRKERKRTVNERCEKVASIVNKRKDFSIVWCHLNSEGDYLEKIINDSVQVAGKHTDEQKEDRLFSFANGNIKCLIIKPKIGAFGLNFQHCNHITYFPSHSYEQYYQAVRRCWRFGQKRAVSVDVIMTEGDELVMKNMQRKANQAVKMFRNLVSSMNNELNIKHLDKNTKQIEVPQWL